MSYKPNGQYGPIRDRTYPSEIAAQRPALATRFHTEAENSFDMTKDSIRGDEGEPDYDTGETHFPSRCEEFNRRLREG